MITIIYITFRENCKFEWFIEPLLAHEFSSNIQLVIVDGLLAECSDETSRRAYFSQLIDNKIDYIHVPPKPTAWQGKYKITNDNYFAASNTRNTGVCYAKHKYIAFVDDLGVISATWIDAVVDACDKQQIHCGAYKKVKDMVVYNGMYVDGDESGGVDHRLKIYNSEISLCPGQHMYGSSFCMRISDYFDVNGQNEMCDGVAGEDYDFGIRLERASKKIYYNKRMLIHEHDGQFGSDCERKCIRADPVISDTEYNNLLKKYNLKNYAEGRKDMSHFMLSCAFYGPVRVNPEFSLAEYNNAIVNLNKNPLEVFLLPDSSKIHFFTGKPVSNGI